MTPFSVDMNILAANLQMECKEMQSEIQLKEKFDRVTLLDLHKTYLKRKKNIPCFTITFYSCNRILAICIFVNNCFQG